MQKGCGNNKTIFCPKKRRCKLRENKVKKSKSCLHNVESTNTIFFIKVKNKIIETDKIDFTSLF